MSTPGLGPADALEAQLAVVEARIRELRTARAAITYDLEHAVREAARLRRHIEEASKREEA